MKNFNFLMLKFAVSLLILNNFTSGGIYQKKLLQNLLANYSILERPVNDDSLPVIIDIGLSIIEILNISNETNKLTFHGWLTLTWNDEYLMWDPNDFGNITSISLPSSKIWLPDITLYGEPHKFDIKSRYNTYVYFNGNIIYVTPNIIETFCNHDETDEYKCDMKFGSWTYSSESIQVKNSSHTVSFADYRSNKHFHVESATSFVEDLKYSCCKETYPSVHFNINIRTSKNSFEANLSKLKDLWKME